jgi:hypothetical protein
LSGGGRFATALVVGIGLAVFGLVGGLLVMAAAMLGAAVLTWFTFGRMAFAGLTTGLGLTWATVFVLAARDCALPRQPCGATPPDMTPHIAIAIGLFVVGLAAALLTRRRAA